MNKYILAVHHSNTKEIPESLLSLAVSDSFRITCLAWVEEGPQHYYSHDAWIMESEGAMEVTSEFAEIRASLIPWDTDSHTTLASRGLCLWEKPVDVISVMEETGKSIHEIADEVEDELKKAEESKKAEA
jgi:hypothetical protein